MIVLRYCLPVCGKREVDMGVSSDRIKADDAVAPVK
jgi:hypothetical protein